MNELECDCRGVNLELFLAVSIWDLRPMFSSLGRKFSFMQQKCVAITRLLTSGGHVIQSLSILADFT